MWFFSYTNSASDPQDVGHITVLAWHNVDQFEGIDGTASEVCHSSYFLIIHLMCITQTDVLSVCKFCLLIVAYIHIHK